MVPDGLQRVDVGAAAAVDQQRRMPAARAPSTSSAGRVADVERLAPAEHPASSQRGLEDRRVRLSRAGAGRGDDAVERAAEPAALQHLGQRAVPVRDADERQPQRRAARPAPAPRRRRRGSGSRPSSSRPATSRPSSRESTAAQRARRLGQRRGVASLVAVLPVVAPSRRGRRHQAVVGLDAERLRQVHPRRLELDQGAERVEQHGAGRGRRSCEHSHGGTRPRMERSTWSHGPELLGAERRSDLGRDHDGGRVRDRIRGRPAGDRSRVARVAGRVTDVRVSRAAQTRLRAGPPPRLRAHPADRRCARAQQLRQDPAARHRAPRVERGARPGDRLRRTSDDRQHGRRAS